MLTPCMYSNRTSVDIRDGGRRGQIYPPSLLEFLNCSNKNKENPNFHPGQFPKITNKAGAMHWAGRQGTSPRSALKIWVSESLPGRRGRERCVWFMLVFCTVACGRFSLPGKWLPFNLASDHTLCGRSSFVDFSACSSEISLGKERRKLPRKYKLFAPHCHCSPSLADGSH